MAGAFEAVKKDGTKYYRASITYKGKHISLGSFSEKEKAEEAYSFACRVLKEERGTMSENRNDIISFSKYIMLVNLRDNGLYCKGPIYLHKGYFDYYLDRNTILRFSAEELFYYMDHTIQRRGNHFFVADYGSQLSIVARYGIRPFAVKGRDYYFKNGDELDFRSGNVVIINKYNGVRKETVKGRSIYVTKIHVNGDLTVGRYDTELEAAIAYNKAADVLRSKGVEIEFRENYIEELSNLQYKLMYQKIRIRIR